MAKGTPKATSSSSESPTASCLLICQDVIRGTVRQRHVLQGVIDRISVRDLPAFVGPFAAYVRLSNVYGGQNVSLTFGRAGADEEVFRLDAKSPKSSDPLDTHTLIVAIPRFEITEIGRYIFQAIHGNVPFAESPVEVRVIDQGGVPMNTTDMAMGVETSSEPAIELVARVVRRSPKPAAAAQITAMNAKMNADPARLMRRAAANTRRLTGKPNL